MKIFEEGNEIRLQLMDMNKRIMLFDFKVEKEAFLELRSHMIEHLRSFEIEKYLHKLADDLEPTTHCCECTIGPHYDPSHEVHIQYPDCECKPELYKLKKNE